MAKAQVTSLHSVSWMDEMIIRFSIRSVMVFIGILLIGTGLILWSQSRASVELFEFEKTSLNDETRSRSTLTHCRLVNNGFADIQIVGFNGY